MKDIKNLIILILLIFSLVFGYIWFWGGGKTYRDKIKNLEKTRLELVKERTKLEQQVDSLKIINELLIKNDEKLKVDIEKKDEEIRKLNKKFERSIIEFNDLKQKIKDTQIKIEEIKKNPIKRTGENLLNSLKNKTEK